MNRGGGQLGHMERAGFTDELIPAWPFTGFVTLGKSFILSYTIGNTNSISPRCL